MRPCTARHGTAQHGAIRERQFMMRWYRCRGVIYSLICCGNGQRIITCKILINVLQQQTSFAKLVICCSAPDSEQLKWHEENKVLSGRTWATPAAQAASGSGPQGRKYKWWALAVKVETSVAPFKAECFEKVIWNHYFLTPDQSNCQQKYELYL